MWRVCLRVVRNKRGRLRWAHNATQRVKHVAAGSTLCDPAVTFFLDVFRSVPGGGVPSNTVRAVYLE